MHIAYWLMRTVLDGTAAESWTAHILEDSWAVTGLTPECFSAVKVQADAQFAETLTMLSNGAVRAV